MITHGILTAHGIFNNLDHKRNEIIQSDAEKESKKINWKEINHQYDPNAPRKRAIFKERWR